MKKEERMKLTLSEGFDKVALIPTKELVFKPEYRKYCEENLCGNYNQNYACPPYCGTPKEMEEKVKQYSYCLVFQSISLVSDMKNEKEIKEAKKEHGRKTKRIADRLKTAGTAGHVIMAGPCSLCEECGQGKNTPCPHKEQIFSCLSAYCIDAFELAKQCGMDYWLGERKVALFSLYLF